MEQSAVITGPKPLTEPSNPALSSKIPNVFKLLCAGLLLSVSTAFAQPPTESTDKNPSGVLMDILVKKARSLAEQDYQASDHKVPAILAV